MCIPPTNENTDWPAELFAAKQECETLRHEREQLALAIRNAAVHAGICREDTDLTGPQLLMLCIDMGEVLTHNAGGQVRR